LKIIIDSEEHSEFRWVKVDEVSSFECIKIIDEDLKAVYFHFLAATSSTFTLFLSSICIRWRWRRYFRLMCLFHRIYHTTSIFSFKQILHCSSNAISESLLLYCDHNKINV
jgi:hypothetical protein